MYRVLSSLRVGSRRVQQPFTRWIRHSRPLNMNSTCQCLPPLSVPQQRFTSTSTKDSSSSSSSGTSASEIDATESALLEMLSETRLPNSEEAEATSSSSSSSTSTPDEMGHAAAEKKPSLSLSEALASSIPSQDTQGAPTVRKQFVDRSVEITIQNEGHDGQGFGYANGKPALVFGAIAGETVRAVPLRDRKQGKVKSYKTTEVITPSEHRVEPKCQHFDHCGGCLHQHVSEDHQIDVLRRTMERQFYEVKVLPDEFLPSFTSKFERTYMYSHRFYCFILCFAC